MKVTGSFKQTRKGALAECIINAVLSVILVFQFGLVGVAIGTVVAMAVRGIELVYYSNKYIMKRNIWESCKRMILIVIEVVVIVLVANVLPMLENSGYFNLILNGVMVLAVSLVVTLCANAVFLKSSKRILCGK